MAALIPDAATYGTEQAAATDAYQKAKNNIQLGQLGLMNRYGLTADYNATTNGYSNYRTDPYSKYGLIQQNRNSEAMDLNAAQDNSVQRGIGTSGLGNQLASQYRYQHGAQDTQLGQDFTSGMGQYNQQLSDAGSAYQQSLFQAENDAIQRALANREFTPFSSLTDEGDNSNVDGPKPLNMFDPNQDNPQPDPFANLNNLTEADWNKLKALPVNTPPPSTPQVHAGAKKVHTSKKVLAKALAGKTRSI